MSRKEETEHVNTSEAKKTSESIFIAESGTLLKNGKSPDDLNIASVTANDKKELINTINLWADAWSDQNVPQYLISYSKEFNVPVGYSDHTLGTISAAAACAIGACMIEKHFTLDKSNTTIRDHALSATPEEFRQMVNLGQDIKRKINIGI